MFILGGCRAPGWYMKLQWVVGVQSSPTVCSIAKGVKFLSVIYHTLKLGKGRSWANIEAEHSRALPAAQMAFTSGCNHPSFTLPWRTPMLYLVALHLLQPGSAQLTVVAPSLRVTANVGQDVVLRCQLSPCKDAWSSDIRWIQLRSSGIVHHYEDGVDLGQMEEYKGRTELLRDGLSDGNLDLRITSVSSSDSGSYSCAVQDGDGYADAVVELEVSDLFSQIVHPWKVALAVVVTLLVGSFVINVFLYRKKAAQSRALKRKDAMLGLSAENLKELASKLNKNADEVEDCNSELKKDCEEMGSGVADLKELAAELEEHSEEMGLWSVPLKLLAAKLGRQTKELEKQHSQFYRHFQHMDSRAVKQKKLVTKLEEHSEQMERRNVKLGESSSPTKGIWGLPWDQPWDDNLNLIMCFLFVPFAEAAAVKVGQQAKESEKQKSELKERHEEMEQTEAVVVATKESGESSPNQSNTGFPMA
ncbi:uncharacterized protein LOC121106920 isoform X2 [Gallus gallus]|uniref:uncharacterized protein LOC121106920 isoform X2 n=1 Tax=Gallus gallus TaxID=9031 RepID=UPI001AE3C51B|nr:uncharacterized protein LOC121106920 isoform X2 [Gallus gallus]